MLCVTYKSKRFDMFQISDETSYTVEYNQLWSKHILLIDNFRTPTFLNPHEY
jgi:hypothetical protein